MLWVKFENEHMTTKELIKDHPLLVSNVRQEKLYTGSGLEVVDAVANVRTFDEAVVGIVSPTYQVFQIQDDILPLAEDLVDAGVLWERAGLIHDGRELFFAFHLPEHITVAGMEEEKLAVYVLLVTSHNGSRPLSIVVTIVRVVCENTLAMALGADRIYKLRHTRNAQLRTQEVREALDMTFKYSEVFAETAEQMINTDFTDADWNKFLDSLVPVPEKEGRGKTQAENVHDALSEEYFYRFDSQHLIGTKWGAWQAVTAYTTHDSRIRATKGKTEEEARTERQMLDMLDGNNMSAKAFALLTV